MSFICLCPDTHAEAAAQVHLLVRSLHMPSFRCRHDCMHIGIMECIYSSWRAILFRVHRCRNTVDECHVADCIQIFMLEPLYKGQLHIISLHMPHVRWRKHCRWLLCFRVAYDPLVLRFSNVTLAELKRQNALFYICELTLLRWSATKSRALVWISLDLAHLGPYKLIVLLEELEPIVACRLVVTSYAHFSFAELSYLFRASRFRVAISET